MPNPKKPSWLDWLWLAQVFKVTVVVTVLSVGVGWGGWGLFRFFSSPSAPPKKPPSTSYTIDKPAKKKEKTASDADSTSLVTGSETSNQIEGNPETELKTLTPAESDWDSVSLLEISALPRCSDSSVAGSEVGSQDTTSLVAISDLTPSSVAGSQTSGESSEPTGESQETHGIDENDTKPESRRTLGLDLAEEQKQKNTVLRQSISCKEGRIRETKLLISKSNSITHKREAEWNSLLNELSAYGIPEEVIREEPTFKELERDKVLVLAGEQARRTKYRAKIGLLRHQIQKDKNNIRELVAIPEEAEETSLTREEISLAIGPGTRSISTFCSSTRPLP